MQQSETLRHKLFSRVVVCGDDDCWDWQGSLSGSRYGQMRVNGRLTYVHRIAYEVTTGEIPAGLFVLHTCDNRKCCNPSHLWLGTNKDNQQDCVQKGRKYIARGAEHPMAKLTPYEVWLIRSLYVSGEFLQREIADAMGINRSYCKRLLQGKSWTEGPFAGSPAPA